MIKYINVKKIYPGNIIALDGVSFEIDEGEFLFIVGASGAGKSTLIRLLVRQEVPTTGNIFFEDVEVPTIPNKLLSIYRQQLGIVFQDLKLIESKTVRENIMFALEITGKDRKEVEDTTQYLLDVVNLKNRSHLFPIELSGGEKQKVAIARALANDPKIFIADEPTGNLDNNTSMEILSILKTINDWGTTVMVITHDNTLVENMKARVITMSNGKIIKDTGRNKANNTSIKLFSKISKDTRMKLKINGINSVDELLAQSEEDLQNIGIKDMELEDLTKKIQNYLTLTK